MKEAKKLVLTIFQELDMREEKAPFDGGSIGRVVGSLGGGGRRAEGSLGRNSVAVKLEGARGGEGRLGAA